MKHSEKTAEFTEANEFTSWANISLIFQIFLRMIFISL